MLTLDPILMRWARLRIGVVAFAFLAAGASPQDDARALYDAGRLSNALAAYEAVLKKGGLGRADLQDVYLHLAILRAGSRDKERAKAAFVALLSLDPETRLDKRWPPTIAEVFLAAQRVHGGGAAISLRLEPVQKIDVGSTCTLVPIIDHDPAGLARLVRVHLFDRPDTPPIEGRPRESIALPGEVTGAAGEVRFEVVLLDEHGSVLAASGSREAPLTVTVAPKIEARTSTAVAAIARLEESPRPAVTEPIRAAAEKEDSHGGVLSSPWFWGSAAAAVILGAIAIGVAASSGGSGAELGPIRVERR